MADNSIVFDYDAETMKVIFDEDQDLSRVLINNNLYIYNVSNSPNPIRLNLYKKLAILLLANTSFIDRTTIEELWTLKFLYAEINAIFSYQQGLPFEIYQQIIFSFKYGTVKHFFQNNWRMFIPSFDVTQINTSDKMNIFAFSFFREFDRLVDILDRTYNVVDIDKTPDEYLTYLIQLLGYEKTDDVILSNAAFRQLAKNILEVYKIKGTNYSYELFFNFLGFKANLVEYWFDKRMKGLTTNPYTGSGDPTKFAFYLTPIKPTNYIPEPKLIDPAYKYPVMEYDISGIRNILLFEKRLKEGYTIETLLGESPNEFIDNESIFTFFKTNVIEFKLERMRGKESDPDTVSSDMDKIIKTYIDFLTPIFIYKIIAVTVNPFEDFGNGIIDLSDKDIRNLSTNRIKSMWHYMANYCLKDEMPMLIDPTNSFGTPFKLIGIGERLDKLDEVSDKFIHIKDDLYWKYIYLFREFDNLSLNYLDKNYYNKIYTNKEKDIQFSKFIDLESELSFRVFSWQSLDAWENSRTEWDDWSSVRSPEKFGWDAGVVDKLTDLGPSKIVTTVDDITYISNGYMMFYHPYLFYDSLTTRREKVIF